jgi:hypothetical protein
MGYHNKKIEKGILGEFSKITEEYQELEDAFEQSDKILQCCELSDLIGAIEEYSLKNLKITLQELITFSNKTKSAFKDGQRK